MGGAALALLIRLPDAARVHVETSQPTVAVGPGIDADGVPEVERLPRTLLRVPTNHDLAGFMRTAVGE